MGRLSWLDFVSNFVNGVRQAVDLVSAVPSRIADYCSFLPSYFLVPFLGIVAILVCFKVVKLVF